MGSPGDLTAELHKLLEGLRPDLRAWVRPSVLGKVVAVHEDSYRVDVVVGGDPDSGEGGLSLPEVPVASVFAQAGYGVWALPEVGAEVTVSFHEGDVTRPYIEAPIWFNNAPPSGYAVGTIALHGKQGQRVVLKPDTSEVLVEAGTVIVKATSGDASVEASGTILLGGAAATESLAKGDVLYSTLTTLITILKTASLQTWGPGTPIPCAPNPANAALLAPVEALLEQIRSTKGKTA
jgi:Type VI secretion system/phage-baseplate injector OB domain